MATLDMSGPYSLSSEEIDRVVNKGSPGNYALGKKNDKGTFLVSYVGRADSDLNARLKQWADESELPFFKYSYATSPKSAFEKECRNFHDFSPPKNKIHPDRPNGSDWKCPVCDVFD